MTKKALMVVLAAWLLMPMTIFGQTYQSLWKQVQTAQDKDLPKTVLAHLTEIEVKARKERAYGQLLKASLMSARVQGNIAPDSIAPAIRRLELQLEHTHELALQAVYATVLSKIYDANNNLDDHDAKSSHYRTLALAHPEVLCKTPVTGYEPFVIKGKDSEVFGHDLLSVVGQELEAWQWLTDYYNAIDNCRAACLTAVHTCTTIDGADSLIAIYGDFAEAGEIAIRRYELMEQAGLPAAERYQWLQESLHRWGSWKRANELRNSLTALTAPHYVAEVPQYIMEPGKSQMVNFITLRNIRQLSMRVYRTDLQGDTQLDPQNEKDYAQIKQKGLVEVTEAARTLSFPAHPEYEAFEDSTQLAGLPAGVYLLSFTTNAGIDPVRRLYFVSGIRLLQQAQPNQTQRYVAVDATTGQPIAGTQLRLGFGRNRRSAGIGTTTTLTCNQQGEAVYSGKQQPATIFAYTAADAFCPEYNGYGRFSYYNRSNNQEHATIYTDRSIYRPGQTVHATIIVWRELSAIAQEAVADKAMTIALRDANYKVVAEQQVTTDRYGKCYVTFTLPTGKLNGTFSLRTANASAYIQVEEYKRPAFLVEFDDYKASYQAGDTVQATAKAASYAGVPVQQAKVHYTVKRRLAFWWMTYNRYWQGGNFGSGLQEEILCSDDTTTADDGTFEVLMPLTLPEQLGHRPMFYHFVVEADVTDSAGETHSATLSLPLGNKASVLTCTLPAQVRSDQLPAVTFKRLNAAGNEIAGKLRYRIDGGKWQEASANVKCSIFTTQLKSGSHHLEAICATDTLRQDFVVFSLADQRPALQTHDWFYVSHEEFPADGSPVTVQVGASDPDLHIVYSLFSGNRMIESGAVERDAALLNRQLTYREEWGNGLLLTYAWVKNGQCYSHQQLIRRPMPDKRLRLQWTTFRDRLTPGQQEEWRLTVSKPDGTPADASLMAVLYDKSLDAIHPHQWSLHPQSFMPQPYTSWQWREADNWICDGQKRIQWLNVPQLSFSRFDNDVFPYMLTFHMLRSNRVMMKAAARPMTAGVLEEKAMANEAASDAVSLDEVVVAGMDVKGKEVETDESLQQEEEPVPLRENLSETAFCYPALRTDQNGNITLSFVLPESLTTWHFMGIANTPDMLYGYIDGEAVAQKDVMVQPNMPRFIREGDKATISARLFNTTGQSVSGTAKLQLLHPESEKVIYEQMTPFSIDANGSVTATFAVDGLPTGHSLLICRITATGDGFNDGEQHYLPILPNREYVTRTVPITQHEAGIKTIDLTKLFPEQTTQQKLTIEYTNNPAWLMVQALPTLGQPCEHSAIDLAASYYSNMLARHLMNQTPQAKGLFEQWKRELQVEQGQQAIGTPQSTTLQSQLEKNEELKDLLLQETPWVVAADRESEQRQHLADFFDENSINNRLQTTVEKLTALQNADGSFSWYPGMEGSTHITVTIAEMLARLQMLTTTLPSSAAAPIYAKTFTYIGDEMTALVAKMKQDEKRGHRQSFPSFTALRWLYLCAIDGRQLSTDVKAANDYLITLLKKDIKRQTIYEKAMTAIVLAQHAEQRKAAEYVRSLKEYTVYTEEMGRYYDTPRAGYTWYDYKIPTQVAAIEAIQRLTPDDHQTIDEMRRWLLQEKRTQTWDTPINSVNAIYAFMNGNNQTLTVAQQPTLLAVDGSPVDTCKPTAALGYVKSARPYQGEHTFTATKTSNGSSWGAVYAQFLQASTNIADSQSGITVRRELLTADSLTVGQRIRVRITIETSRDLDFVQVVDRRAACMEPVNQLSGYHNGAYCSPKDHATHYFFRGLAKGKHVIETEYYIDRAGTYQTGTCTAGCAYAPEFRATTASQTLIVK